LGAWTEAEQQKSLGGREETVADTEKQGGACWGWDRKGEEKGKRLPLVTMDRRALPGAIRYIAQSHTQGALLSVINM